MSARTYIQRKKAADRDAAPQFVHDTLRAGGQPLDDATRAFMEPRFGHDFGQVQIQHTILASTFQPKLTISQPGDPYEQEADRVADAVVNGSYASVGSLSAHSSVQRDAIDEPPPQSSGQLPPDAEWPPSDSGPSANKELAKGLETIGKAIQKTPAGKELKRKAEALGADLWSHLDGKVVIIVGGAAAVGTLLTVDGELPAAIPDIPLDWAVPGLKANLTYEGPLRKPTKIMLTLTLSFGGGETNADTTLRPASDAQADEFRRFQQNTHYTPGTPEAREEAVQQAAYIQWIVSQLPSPRNLGDPARLGLSLPNVGQGSNQAADQSNPFQLTPPTFGENLGKPLHPRLVPELYLDEPFIMRKASELVEAMTAPPVVQEVLQSSGQPLDNATRAFMEPRFGHDFGRVRVHTGAQATESARSVNALAYTVGSDVVFGAGQYQPSTNVGRRLLAHELTHVVQQGQNSIVVQRYKPSIPTVDHPSILTMAEFIEIVKRIEISNPGMSALQVAKLIMRTKYNSAGFDYLLPSSAGMKGVTAGEWISQEDKATLTGEFDVTLPEGGPADPSHIMTAIVSNMETQKPGAGHSAGIQGIVVEALPHGLSQRDVATWVGDIASAAAEWQTVHTHPKGGTTKQHYLDEYAPESDLIADIDGIAISSRNANIGFVFDLSASLSSNLELFYFPSQLREGKNRRFHTFCAVEGFELEQDGVTLSTRAIAAIHHRVRINAEWFTKNDPDLLAWTTIQIGSPDTLVNPMLNRIMERLNDWQWFADKFCDFIQRNLCAEGQ